MGLFIVTCIFFVLLLPFFGMIVTCKIINSEIFYGLMNDNAISFICGYVVGILDLMILIILLSQIITIGGK